MAFELFVGKQKSTSREPKISILKSGILFCNASCYEKFLAKNKYVNFLYDKDTNTIGIKPTDTNDGYSYLISKSAGRSGCAITSRSFCIYYGIKFDKSRTYKASWNEELKLVEVKLD